jgi:hypothetical protein
MISDSMLLLLYRGIQNTTYSSVLRAACRLLLQFPGTQQHCSARDMSPHLPSKNPAGNRHCICAATAEKFTSLPLTLCRTILHP